MNRITTKLRSLRTGKSGAVGGLRSQWSKYPNDWKRSNDLNMGFATLGEEWGGPDFADLVVEELAKPYLGTEADVLELGCGGGKFSQRLAPRCKSLLCSDISPKMIQQTKAELARKGVDGNVSFKVVNGIDFDGIPDRSIDFVFSYDVQLHLQPQNVFSYMIDARRVLRDDGVFMLHQIDLASEGGMGHFLIQYGGGTWTRDFDHLGRRGHIYFMSEDQMRAMAEAAGLVVDRIVAGFPGEGLPLREVTSGRDLVGFFKMKPSRLRGVDPASAPLLQINGERAVYVVVDGERMAISSPRQFERAGFKWDQIRKVPAAELEAIPEAPPLEIWE